MNDRKYAKRVFSAIEQIDAEMLYDARSYHAPKIKPYIRYMVAAVLVLMILSAVLVYTVTGTVHSYMTIDTDYGVTLELNASGTVVRVTPCTPHYKEAAQSCSYMSADAASDVLICSMGERGGLNSDANTVLFGYTEDSKNAVDPIAQQLVSDQLCVVSAKIGDEDAAQHLAQKRHITAGKAAYILLLSRAEKHMDENRLFRLCVNDIALLAVSKEVSDPEISVIGTPSDSGYLAPEKAKAIALSAEGVTTDRVVCELDSDGFRLIYIVMLYYGDRGAAYFITADQGVIRNVVYGSANTLERDVDEVRREMGETSDAAGPVTDQPVISPTAYAEPIAQDTATAAETVDADNRPTDSQKATESNPDPVPSTQPATAAPATEAPTASAENDTYLFGRGWWNSISLAGTDIKLVDVKVRLSTDYTYASFIDEKYNNIFVYLLCSEAQKEQYLSKENGSAEDFETLGSDLSGDKALLVADVTESFANRDLKSLYFFTYGDILYVGVYEDDSLYTDTKLVTSRCSRRYIEVDKSAVEHVSRICVIHLEEENLIKSKLSYILDQRDADYLYCDTWCNDSHIAADSAKQLSFDNFGYVGEDRIASADEWRYQRSVALLRDENALERYRSEHPRIGSLVAAPDTYSFRDKAVIVITNAEWYTDSAPSYRFVFIRHGVTLYVCYVEENNRGRQYAETTRIRVHQFRVPKTQLEGIKRIVPVNAYYHNGKYLPVYTVSSYQNTQE